MTNRLRDLNEALPEILVIDLLYLIIGEIVIFLLFENPAKFAVGFLAGVIYAIFCVLNMSFKVRKVVYGKANPKKSYLLGYLLRLTVMIAIFAMLYRRSACGTCWNVHYEAVCVSAAGCLENIVQNTKKRRKRMWGAWV